MRYSTNLETYRVNPWCFLINLPELCGLMKSVGVVFWGVELDLALRVDFMFFNSTSRFFSSVSSRAFSASNALASFLAVEAIFVISMESFSKFWKYVNNYLMISTLEQKLKEGCKKNQIFLYEWSKSENSFYGYKICEILELGHALIIWN